MAVPRIVCLVACLMIAFVVVFVTAGALASDFAATRVGQLALSAIAVLFGFVVSFAVQRRFFPTA